MIEKKKVHLKKAPVLVQIYPDDIHKSDLMKELKIDRHKLDRELMQQPARYAFWAFLYSAVSAKVSFLQEQLDAMEADLFVLYAKRQSARRVSDIKFHVQQNPLFKALKARLRRWQDSERVLKYAERAFQQRKDVLMAINANYRSEKKADNFRESSD